MKCCYKCENRHTGCHCTCEAYKSEREELDRLNEKIRQEKMLMTIQHEVGMPARSYITGKTVRKRKIGY